jgi:1,4-alpha-glucan branching enzyme
MRNGNKRSGKRGNGEPQRVHFEFTSPSAEAVYIAGTFNEWQEKATPMVALGGGRWAKDLMLAPGVYAYRLVVDGRWMADPSAHEAVPNPFGESDSVCKVENGG